MPPRLPLSADQETLVAEYERDRRQARSSVVPAFITAARTFCYHTGLENWAGLGWQRQTQLSLHQRAFVGWLVVTGRMAATADYLVMVRGHLGELAARYHRELHERFVSTAAGLGYSQQLITMAWATLAKTAALAGIRPHHVTATHLQHAQAELRAARERLHGQTPVPPATGERWPAVHNIMFHAGMTDQPAPAPTRPARREWRATQWARIPSPMVETMRTYLEQTKLAGARPSTCTRDERVLREFALFLLRRHPEVTSVSLIARTHIETYKRHLARRKSVRGGHLAPATIGHTLNALSVFFDRLVEWDSPDRPGSRLLFPGDYPRKNRPLPRFLDDGTAATLLAAARSDPDPFTRLVIELLSRTGLRRGELIGLTIDAVVQIGSAYWLRVPVGKMRTDRYVPLHPQLKDLIDAWLAARPARVRSNLLFVDHGRPINPIRVEKALKRVARAAGLGNITPHQLRHTLATQAVNRGMSMEAIAALLGHKDLSMTQVYAKIANKTVADQYFAVTEKIEALYDQPRELPAEAEGDQMRKLRAEMHRRMLGNGYCARPVELDCHFESICESCTFFVTTIEFRPTLEKQRDDAASKGQVARQQIFDGLIDRLDSSAS
jgi:site-specific recombinase XerD